MKATLDTQTPNTLGTPITLSLDKVALDPITDVRSGPAGKDETVRIDNLAKSMYEEGQLQPIVVRPGTDGTYLLIAGRRRFLAKQLIAKHLADNKQLNSPVTIDAIVVDKDDDQAYIAAIQENLQRKQFSPIELAGNIAEIRRRKDFNGPDWSKQVADFLRVSRATVTTHAALLELPVDIRAKTHRGELTAQMAFDLLSVAKAKGTAKAQEVLADAEEAAKTEAAEKAAKAGKPGKGKSNEPTPVSGSKNSVPDKARVTREHILDAARKTDSIQKPRTRAEILALFEAVLESADPYPPLMVDFCKTLVTRYATGLVGDRGILNKLDAISEALTEKPARKKAS